MRTARKQVTSTICSHVLRTAQLGGNVQQCRHKFVSSTFDQREAVRKARRDIFGQFPRLKYGPEGHSMKKELRKRPYGPAMASFQRPHLKDYKFVFHETDVTEDMWQDEQNMKKLGRTVRDKEHQKPIREELDVLMRIDQYNDDELIRQEDPGDIEQLDSPILAMRPHSKQAQELLRRARQDQEDADKRMSRDDMAAQEAAAQQLRADAAAAAAAATTAGKDEDTLEDKETEKS